MSNGAQQFATLDPTPHNIFHQNSFTLDPEDPVNLNEASERSNRKAGSRVEMLPGLGGPGVSKLIEEQEETDTRKLNRLKKTDFIDFDPCLQNLRGMSMYTASTAASFARRTSGGGPGCNYQNVDLFTIPNARRMAPKSEVRRKARLTQIEQYCSPRPDSEVEQALNVDIEDELSPSEAFHQQLSYREQLSAANQTQLAFGVPGRDQESALQQQQFKLPVGVHLSKGKTDTHDLSFQDILQRDLNQSTRSFPNKQVQFPIRGLNMTSDLSAPNNLMFQQKASHLLDDHSFSNSLLDSKSKTIRRKRLHELEAEGEDSKSRQTPVLHMQFDEIASRQLSNTYQNKFLKKGPLERRNPLKYMRNPNQVFGMTQGTMQYTFKDPLPLPGRTLQKLNLDHDGSQKRSLLWGSTQRSTMRISGDDGSSLKQRQSSTLRPIMNNSPSVSLKQNQESSTYSINVHNLMKATGSQEEDARVLQPVPQMTGRGQSVSPPTDRPYVINNVIKPFRATSEIDRQRATQILDYIIKRRKMAGRRKEGISEAKQGHENQTLLQQIELEMQAKNFVRSKMSQDGTIQKGPYQEEEDFDEFEMDDKYGNVLQKDLDKITGGVSVFKNIYREFKHDIEGLDKVMKTPEEGARPSQGNTKFYVSQLEQNKFFKDFVEMWDKKIERLIDNQPAIQKYDLKGKIKDTMLEMSPVRKARQEVHKAKANKTGNFQMHLVQPKADTISQDTDLMESIGGGFLEPVREKSIVKKYDKAKDTFSYVNKHQIEKRAAEQVSRHSRMKSYNYKYLEKTPSKSPVKAKPQKKPSPQPRESDNFLNSPSVLSQL